MKVKFFPIARDLENGGAAGGAGAAGAAGAAAAPALVKAAAEGAGDGKAAEGQAAPGAAGKGAEGQAAPADYWPEGLPDTFKGKDLRETLDNLAKDITGRPKAPEKPEGYELKLSDDLRERYGDLTDDEMLPLYRNVAHKHGLTPDQFNGFFHDLYGEMTKAGMLSDPAKIKDQVMSLGGTAGDPKERFAAGSQRIRAAVGEIAALATREVITEAEAAEMIQVAKSVNGVTAIEKLLKLTKSPGVQGAVPGSAAAQQSEEQRAINALYPSMVKS